MVWKQLFSRKWRTFGAMKLTVMWCISFFENLLWCILYVYSDNINEGLFSSSSCLKEKSSGLASLTPNLRVIFRVVKRSKRIRDAISSACAIRGGRNYTWTRRFCDRPERCDKLRAGRCVMYHWNRCTPCRHDIVKSNGRLSVLHCSALHSFLLPHTIAFNTRWDASFFYSYSSATSPLSLVIQLCWKLRLCVSTETELEKRCELCLCLIVSSTTREKRTKHIDVSVLISTISPPSRKKHN